MAKKKVVDEDLVMNIIINGDQGKKEMGALDRVIKDTSISLEKNRATLKKLEQQGKQNSKQYIKLTAEIEKQEGAVKAAKTRYEELVKGLNIVEMTMGDLQKRQRQLNQDLRNTKPNSPEYAKLNKELATVNHRMDELRGKTKKTSLSMSSLADTFNRYAAISAAVILIIDQVLGKLKEARRQFVELEGKMSDVMKTTGLTRGKVSLLNKELGSINTRTSQKELLDLASIAGKLGKTGFDDIHKFTDAGNMILVSLKKDLGGDAEGAISAIGKLSDLFKLTDEFDIDTALLKIGSAINTLGASSTANEGYIVKFSQAIGGVGKSVNMPIEDILAIGATLDSLGQKAEVSSSSVSRVLIGMFEKTSEFASIAGMEIKDFTTLLNTDISAALITVLNGLGKDGIDSVIEGTKLVGLTGVESVNVLSSLASNVKLLETQMDISRKSFTDGMSIIDEYNIKNNDAEAQMEKAIKIRQATIVELGNKATPILKNVTSMSTMLIKGLLAIIESYASWGKYVVALTAFFIVNSSVIKIATVVQALYRGSISETMKTTKAYIIVGYAKMLYEKLSLALTKLLTAGNYLYSASILLMRGRIISASRAMKLFSATLKMSPVGWITTVILALGAGLILLYKHFTKLNKEQKIFNDLNKSATSAISDESAAIKSQLSIAENENLSRKQRNEAIRKLQELMPGGIDLINQETIANGKAKRSVDAHIQSLLQRAKVDAVQNKLKELAAKELDLETNGIEYDAWDRLLVAFAPIYAGGNIVSEKDLLAEIKSKRKALMKYLKENEIKTSSDKSWSLYSDEAFLNDKKILDETITDTKERNKKIIELENKHLRARITLKKDSAAEMQNMEKLILMNNAKLTSGSADGSGSSGGSFSSSEDIQLLTEKFELKKRLRSGDIKSTEEYNRLIMSAEIAFLNRQLENTNISSIQRMKIEEDLFDKHSALAEQSKKRDQELLNIIQSDIDKENTSYKERLIKLNLFGRDKLTLRKDEILALEKLDTQHSDKIDAIENKTINHSIAVLKSKQENKLLALRANHVQELALITDNEKLKKDTQVRHQKEEEQLIIDHITELGSHISSMLNDNELSIDGTDIILSEEQKDALKVRINEVILEVQRLKDAQKDGNKEGMFSFESGGSTDILGMSEKDWELLLKNIESGDFNLNSMIATAKILSNTFSLVNQAMTAAEDRNFQNFEEKTEQKKDSLKKQLDQGIISQDDYYSKVESLDENLDSKKNELEKKQAIRNKAQALFDIAINTAVAAAFVLKTPWLVPVVIAMGAIQAGIVLATPLPGYEDGGLINVQRAQDGKMFNARKSNKRGLIQNPSILVAENGAELVLNNDFVKNPSFSPLMKTFLKIQNDGTARNFDFSKINGPIIRGFNAGGVTQLSTQTLNQTPSERIDISTSISEKTILRFIERMDQISRDGIIAKNDPFSKGGYNEVIDKITKIINKNRIK